MSDSYSEGDVVDINRGIYAGQTGVVKSLYIGVGDANAKIPFHSVSHHVDTPTPPDPPAPPAADTKTRMSISLSSGWDSIAKVPANQTWIKAHFSEARGYPPTSDSYRAWFQDASHKLVSYQDLYAIWPNSSKTYQAKSVDGKLLNVYGEDTLAAAAFWDQGWINYFLGVLQHDATTGYDGFHLDDLNVAMKTMDPRTGQSLAPKDPKTGKAMTLAAWQNYMALFVEAIRNKFPDLELIGNIVWFHASDWRSNPYVQRCIASVNVLNVERGFNDPNMDASDFLELGAWIDAAHAGGKSVIINVQTDQGGGREYALATYLLHRELNDSINSNDSTQPTNWWTGYEVNLGAPTGFRYKNPDGSWSRDFTGGKVTANPTTRSASVPGVS